MYVAVIVMFWINIIIDEIFKRTEWNEYYLTLVKLNNEKIYSLKYSNFKAFNYYTILLYNVYGGHSIISTYSIIHRSTKHWSCMHAFRFANDHAKSFFKSTRIACKLQRPIHSDKLYFRSNRYQL